MKSIFVFLVFGTLLCQVTAYSILRTDEVFNSVAPVKRQAVLADCPADSIAQSFDIATFKPFHFLVPLNITVPITAVSSSVTACFVINSPLAGYTAGLSFEYPFNTTYLPFNYSISYNDNEPVVGPSPSFGADGPFTPPQFFAPPASAYLSSDSQKAVIVINFEAGAFDPADTFDVVFSVLVADASWNDVNTTFLYYPLFAGALLSASIPPIQQGSSNVTANTFKYSVFFTEPLAGPVILTPCFTTSAACASGPSCIPGSLSAATIKNGSTSYSATYTIPSKIGTSNCPVEGIAIQIVPSSANIGGFFENFKYESIFNPSKSSSGLSNGAIIGIAVGVAVAVIILVIAAVYIYRRQQHSDYQEF